MPIYEFRCQACGEIFELLALSQGEKLQARCPHCAGEDIMRVLSTCASVVGAGATGRGSAQPAVQSRSCGSDSCTTLTLPGHSKD